MIMKKGVKVGRFNTGAQAVQPKLRQMQDIHHEMVRMLLIGIQPKEIAERLKIHRQTVINVKNSPLVVMRLAALHKARDANAVELSNHIMEVAPAAMRIIDEAVNEGTVNGEPLTPNAHLGACERHLSRAGHPEMSKSTVHLSNTNILTLADINEIKEVSRANAVAAGLVVSEAEFTEVEDES